MPEAASPPIEPNSAQMRGPETSSPQTVKNSPEDAQLLFKCRKMLDEGKAHRDTYSKDWEACRKFYMGEQWYDNRRPSYRPSTVLNICWPTVNTIHPIMTDLHPGFEVGPTEPADYKFAELLTHQVSHWWKRESCSMVISDTILDSLQITHGVAKVTWDQDRQQGEGDVTLTCIDPGSVLVPKAAIDFETKCPWVIHIMSKSVRELKKLYPDKAERIRQTSGSENLNSNYDGKGDSNNQWKTQAESGEAVLVSPTDRKDPRQGAGATDVSGTGTAGDDKMVEVFEIWMDDFTMVDDEDQDGAPIRKLKYPKGRLVTVSFELNLILQDKPNPRADGRKPFAKLVDLSVPRNFAGIGEIKPLIEVQKYINKLWATIMDWANSMSNPVWILDNTSGVSARKITNQVGLVITKNPGTEVRRESAPPFPPQLLDCYQHLRDYADTASGVHDVTQGRRPGGITAAQAIEGLQEAAQTRIRAKERNLESFMTDIGQLVIATMLQYYRTPRVVKVSGTDEGWPKFFEFYIENDDSENSSKYMFNRREYVFDEESKSYRPKPGWEKLGSSKGIYDVEVLAGTSLPYQKSKVESLAISLFRDGVIDEKAVLDTIDFPGKEDVLRRKEEALAEQQAMEAGGMPPQAAPPPPM